MGYLWLRVVDRELRPRGTLWFSYTPGLVAAIGDPRCTRLQRGFSFTDSASAPRYLELSLVAEEPLSYCLATNQRNPQTGGGGIEEAPADGRNYARRNGRWVPLDDSPIH